MARVLIMLSPRYGLGFMLQAVAIVILAWRGPARPTDCRHGENPRPRQRGYAMAAVRRIALRWPARVRSAPIGRPGHRCAHRRPARFPAPIRAGDRKSVV